jgi:uncharacterized protein
MRKDIDFRTTDGTVLRGWHYVPPTSGKHPTIVMAHGLGAVKEMYLDRYAEAFAKAGLASIVYDHRNFGASDGALRQELDPWLQVRDYSDAITFAGSLAQTDPERVGIWGSSYSGGHVLAVAAIDRRVKCVVAQIPLISGSAYFQGRFSPDAIAQLEARFHADRAKRAMGHPPEMVPIVTADDPLRRDAYEWYTRAATAHAPSWQNRVTLRSIEYTAGYEPGAYTGLISSAPLLLIAAENDVLPLSIAEAAYARVCEPKRLIVLPCGHWDVYTAMFDQSATPACDWFCAHLRKQ